MSLDFEIRPSVPSDEQSILAAFSHAFAKSRSKNIWRWIYQDNPGDSINMLCLNREGEVVAHAGAIFHRAVYQGKIIKIGQVRDAFSHPRFRSVMKERAGLFAHTMRSLFKQYGTTKGISFFYGFPSSRHLQLGCKQLDYREGNKWGRLVYSIRRTLPNLRYAYGFISETSKFDESFDQLLCRQDINEKISIIHDSRFLSWRFHSSSKNSYWIWTYTPHLSRIITGYVIFTRRKHKAILLDFHFPMQMKAYTDFWMQIIERLVWNDIKEIEAYLSFNHHEMPKLYELGFVQSGIAEDVRLCFHLLKTSYCWEMLNEKFSFTMADSDLY